MKKIVLIYTCLLLSMTGYVQTNPADSSSVNDESLAIDTTIDYDDLLSELDSFLDSILAPRSYFLASISTSRAYFNFIKGDTDVTSKSQMRFSPTIGYYHKTGIGLTLSGDITSDGKSQNLYQYAITPSYDFIQNFSWVAGFSYSRYITKNELPFYTTPLQNEVNGYFLLRKGWLQPGITANYGWGSRTDVKKRIFYIKRLRDRNFRRRNTDIPRPILDSLLAVLATKVTEEGVSDFSTSVSVRHNFYWLNIGGHNSYIKFTPLLTCSFGTQKFGFNQSTNITARSNNSNINNLNVQNVTLNDKVKFQPLSLTLYLRPEYVLGKFFIQPQLMLDYYFPAKEKNFTTLFSVNAGVMF